MVNGVLFLHIYEGVQKSRKYGNLTSTIPENNITAALTGSKYTENLTSTIPENNNTAALTGSEIRKPAKYKSTKETEGGAKMLTKAYGGWRRLYTPLLWRNLCQIALQKKVAVRSPLVSCVFVVFSQPQCSWGPLLAWRFTFQDCLAETLTRCGPARWHFPINLDQDAILNGINNGTPYANPDLAWKFNEKH